jgi:hypothetical protein
MASPVHICCASALKTKACGRRRKEILARNSVDQQFDLGA